MAGSLLAYLYPHIKGSQEDVATLALCHILSQSDSLRSRFTRLLAERLHMDIQEALNYSTQVTGKEKERPDIVGTDAGRKETIICEVKFFAALTDNQPVGYLKRLSGQTNCGLIFLCPQSRMVGLWHQVLTRAASLFPKEIDEMCADMSGIRMSIICWNEVLEVLTQTASERDIAMLGDIQQLVGFCREVENAAFIPFKEEDFGADVARRMDRYNLVVDCIANWLLKQDRFPASKRGLHATPQYSGYTQYMRVSKCCIGINYYRSLWEKQTSLCTPFWLYLTNSNWKQDDMIMQYLKALPDRMTEIDSSGSLQIALTAPVSLSLEETAKSLCDQILEHIDAIEKGLPDFINSTKTIF